MKKVLSLILSLILVFSASAIFVSAEATVNIASVEVMLGESLSVICTTDVDYDTGRNYTMHVDFNGRKADLAAIERNGKAAFRYDGVAPQEMAKKMVVTVYDGKTAVSDTYKNLSIKNVCVSILKTDYVAAGMSQEGADAVYQLVSDMLQYGEKARVYHNPTYEKISNVESELGEFASRFTPSDLTDFEQKSKELSASTNANVAFTGASIWFDTTNRLFVQLKTDNADKTDIVINGDTFKGEEVKTGVYGVYGNSIPAYELKDEMQVELKYNGETVQTLKYSLGCYVSDICTKDNTSSMAYLAKSLLAYSASVKEYADGDNGNVLPSYVVKGAYINITADGIESTEDVDENTFLVLSVNGNNISVVKVLPYGDSFMYFSDEPSAAYAGSQLDIVMNEYYAGLDSKIQAAIIPQIVSQEIWSFPASFTYENTGESYLIGERYVYALSISEILDYIGTDENKIWDMYNALKMPSEVWLRSVDSDTDWGIAVVWCSGYTADYRGKIDYDSFICSASAQPAFVIDAGKLCKTEESGNTDYINKGALINITAGCVEEAEEVGENTFRVLSVDGNNASVVSMCPYGESFEYYDGEENYDYADSTLDKMMSEYYDGLDSKIKNAIVPQNIRQEVWIDSGDYMYEPVYVPTGMEATKPIGERSVYALGVGDVLDYIGSDYYKVWELFDEAYPFDAFWLRSNESYTGFVYKAISYSPYAGKIFYDDISYSGTARPAFVIDLNKLDVKPSTVTPGTTFDAVEGATFVNGDGTTSTLTWKELKNAANGTKYGYDASLIADTAIREKAFYKCASLTSLIIPGGVTSIGRSAFNNCSALESVTIPDGVIGVSDYAFANSSNLIYVSVPDSVTSIGGSAFYGCGLLSSINFQGTKAEWGAITKGSYWDDKTGDYIVNCTDGSILEAKATFDNGDGTATTLTWEELKDAANGTKYGYNAYAITDSAIAAYAFDECDALTSITISNEITNVDAFAFGWCSNLTRVAIPNSVTNIGYAAFSDCLALNTVVIPNSITSISDSTFSYCVSLTSVIIPNSVISIEDGALSSCVSLTHIAIPSSVRYIGSGAFYNCIGLTSVEVPHGVTRLLDDVFAFCESLTTVTIPNTVKSIDIFTFAYSTNITSVTFKGTAAQWEAIKEKALRWQGVHWNRGCVDVYCSDLLITEETIFYVELSDPLPS